MENQIRSLVESVTNASVNHVNMALALAAALAWNEAVKSIIKTRLSSTNLSNNQVVYALVITVIAALVMVISKRYLSAKAHQDIGYVVSA